MALILDTGPLYALMDRDDADHMPCRRLLRDNREPLVIPEPVLVEVDYLINRARRPVALLALLSDITSGVYRVEGLQIQDYSRIRELCGQYRDAEIGFVDAAVLAVVERLGEPKLATLDRRHFSYLRPRHVTNLTLLP